jgi:uncharacterized cupredoxin-like copper-binding protein
MKRLAIASTALAFGLAAAGVAIGSGGTKLKTSADPNAGLSYTTKVLHAQAGKVTIVMRYPNTSANAVAYTNHNIAIKGHGVNVKGKVVYPGGTSTVTAVLKPGVYEFYCSVPGHEAAGMKGTLIVK